MSSHLVPYVPRVTLEWLRTTPENRYRELDGTLAFVDISGFTALSERLAREGKAGAEQVTDVMNSTFARLLEVAYEYGGSLLKFGGDALLLLFADDDHAARAARAAWGMRRELRPISRPSTSAGSVTLRMHVGVHTGVFQLYLVGDSHRELLVTGPAATRTVLMESTAEAGEILLSGATAAALEPRALGARKGDGRLLRAEAAAEPRPEPLPDTTGLDLAPLVPDAVRRVVATPAAEGEHRNAAVAFLRFGGVDELTARDGVAAVAEALDELVRHVQAAAGDHGVCVLESDVDADGGKLVLVAGAPQATENDEERLLRAVRAVADAPLRLPLRIGVHRGRVFAGEVGAEFRRTYTILGDTAALAARLMARAKPGQVLASGEAVGRSRTAFEASELPPFRVKGRSEPVRAFALGRVAGTRELRAERRLDLVDRERELAILGAALGPVRAGFGSLVELVGDPGIGKSRIVDELRSQAPDMTALAAVCEQYEAGTPYFAFRDLLRRLVDVPLDGTAAGNTKALRERLQQVAPELLPWVPLLALPLDVEVESTPETEELQPAFRRARLHGAVSNLLEALLGRPTMLVFEDVHWMDEASAELLRHLAAQISTRPWFACATRRPVAGGFAAAEGTPPVPALTIRLDPLPPEDARALVASVAPAGLAGRDLDAIADRGGGNPLFLQELVASHAAHEEDELPESVEAVVASRIDGLDAPDRALLRWASVLGQSFDGELIARVLEGDPSAAGDSEAWDRVAEFVERDPDVAGGFRFRHAIIRDAAYEGLPFRRRRELHGRVGEVVEARSPDEVELLSLHFSRARMWEKAWRCSWAAGERARAKHANVEAAEFYRRALEATAALPELDRGAVARVWEALADVCLPAGLLVDAANALSRARRLTPVADPGQPSLMLKEGLVREEMGRYADALRWYTRGMRAADLLGDARRRAELRVELAMAYAQARFRQGRLLDCARRCLAVATEAQALDDLRNVAHAYYLLHVVHTLLGSPERTAFRGLALPIYEELGDLVGQASVLNNLGIEAYYEGRWQDALELYGRSRAFRERIGDVINVATTTNNIGEIRSDQGHLDEAAQLFTEALRIAEAAGQRLIATVARSNLARVAARAERLDEAEHRLREALTGFEEIGAGSFVLETRARLAEVLIRRGDRAPDAYELAGETLRSAEEAGGMAALVAMLERLRGLALLQAGDLAAGAERLERSLDVARGAEAAYEEALTLAALGRVDESAPIFERLGVVGAPQPLHDPV